MPAVLSDVTVPAAVVTGGSGSYAVPTGSLRLGASMNLPLPSV